MPNEKSQSDHATLEAQRQKSNVYAYRRVKWGAPQRHELRRGGFSSVPTNRRGGKWLNAGALIALGVAVLAVLMVVLGG